MVELKKDIASLRPQDIVNVFVNQSLYNSTANTVDGRHRVTYPAPTYITIQAEPLNVTPKVGLLLWTLSCLVEET